jgi:porin
MGSFAERSCRTGRSLAALTWLVASTARADDVGCTAPDGCPGVDVTVGYAGEWRRNLDGGLERGDAPAGLLKLGVAWRTESLLRNTFATTSASVIHIGGTRGVSGTLVGDLQGLSNIEAPPGWYLYDLWTEFGFGREHTTTLRAGLLDLNADFDTSDTGSFFILPSFGIGTDLAQTGANGPAIYPVTGLGLRIGGELSRHAAWMAAAFEAVPGSPDSAGFATLDLGRDHGALLIAELDFTPAGTHEIAVGAWTYTAPATPLSGDSGFDSDAGATANAGTRGNRGAYAFVDAPLGSAGAAHFDGLLRIGVANARHNAVETYVGAALIANNLLETRPYDALGIAVAHGRTGRAFRNGMLAAGARPAAAETQVEMTWRTQLLTGLSLAPSLQWIDAPGADRAVADAWVIGLRFELSLSRSWTLPSRQAPSLVEVR